MQWKDSYSIGNEEIDFQHKELINMTDKLQKSLTKDSEDSNIVEALKFIVKYTRHHFESEERYMERIGYPGLESQKQLHQGIVKNVSDIFLQLKRGHKIDLVELVNFLVDWVIDHVISEDGKIGEYFRNNREKLIENDINQEQYDLLIDKFNKLKELFSKGLINAEDFKEQKSKIVNNFISSRDLKDFCSTCVILDKLLNANFITEKELLYCITDSVDVKTPQETMDKIMCIDGKFRYIKALFESDIISEDEYNDLKKGLLENM